MAFLFDPADVAARLSTLSHIRAKLGDPHHEGELSRAFPLARKSSSQIYRVLGNAHFPNLEALLKSLDLCLKHGFDHSELLKTRANTNFVASLAELQATEHFILRRLDVKKIPSTGGSSIPDLVVRGPGFEVAVEVYCPRRWQNLADFLDDIKDVVKNLDSPFDYHFKVCTTEIKHFDADGNPLWFHPGDLADRLPPDVREDLIGQLVDELAKKISGSGSSLIVAHDRSDLNIRISIVLSSIEPSRERLPSRYGAIVGPTLSGYAPEGIFERLIDRALGQKAAKGEAVGYASRSLLLIDLSRSDLTRELDHHMYRRMFDTILQTKRARGLAGYDMVALCQATEWGQELRLHWWIQESHVPVNVARALFPAASSSNPASPGPCAPRST